eukprot:9479329-Pyramimonas_sp.AAC.1
MAGDPDDASHVFSHIRRSLGKPRLRSKASTTKVTGAMCTTFRTQVAGLTAESFLLRREGLA